jgi:DNA-binding IclR family transcriptional regulator
VRVVRTNPEGRHLPEVRLLAWSGLLPRHDVTDVARDLVAELVAEVGETACLLTYDAAAAEGRYALVHACDQPIQYVMSVGSCAPLHAGAGGKAILAFADRAAWPRAPLRSYTSATMTSVAALDAEMAEIRERGFATSAGEHLADAAGVAAPYFVDRIVVGSVTITMPRYRFDPALISALARPLLRCCSELTELLSVQVSHSS